MSLYAGLLRFLSLQFHTVRNPFSSTRYTSWWRVSVKIALKRHLKTQILKCQLPSELTKPLQCVLVRVLVRIFFAPVLVFPRLLGLCRWCVPDLNTDIIGDRHNNTFVRLRHQRQDTEFVARLWSTPHLRLRLTKAKFWKVSGLAHFLCKKSL